MIYNKLIPNNLEFTLAVKTILKKKSFFFVFFFLEKNPSFIEWSPFINLKLISCNT